MKLVLCYPLLHYILCNLGVAIVGGSISVYGQWEYYCNGSWTVVNITNPSPLGKSSTIQLILLRPIDRIRFTQNGDKFWNRITASEVVNFKFLAWDQSDSLSCGFHVLNASKTLPSSLSRTPSTCIQLRKGCDGRAGTVAVLDSCGVCGGDNSTCLGCDGVLNSGAILGKSNETMYQIFVEFLPISFGFSLLILNYKVIIFHSLEAWRYAHFSLLSNINITLLI